MQKAVQQFISTCGKASIFVENDMPIGIFHDFLMHIKGIMVEKMMAVHKEELEISDSMKKEDEAAV